uniref:ATP synthase subunit a, chloroplastic n=1 Tax=Boodlea composita TaxID=204414 RepID=A0A2H4UXS4_9CHLO|nr:ATP synthase CF0 A subunit [Boodlea composita]
MEVGVRWASAQNEFNYDTLATSASAIIFLCFVPAARDFRLSVFLFDLTAIQALVIGWAPLVSASFLFIWACNWLGALVPWSFFEVPAGELAAPTNDINVTTLLALCAAHGYAFAGFDEYRGRYPGKYLKPVAFLLPINVLEEFSKPLSLSFRLFGNILADELTLSVLYGLVPVGIPIPVFLLGLFTSGIQALVFATLAAAYVGEAMEVLG